MGMNLKPSYEICQQTQQPKYYAKSGKIKSLCDLYKNINGKYSEYKGKE